MKKTVKMWGIYNPMHGSDPIREAYPFEGYTHEIANEKNNKYGFNPPLIVIPVTITYQPPTKKITKAK